jgi:hypothetical protein
MIELTNEILAGGGYGLAGLLSAIYLNRNDQKVSVGIWLAQIVLGPVYLVIVAALYPVSNPFAKK